MSTKTKHDKHLQEMYDAKLRKREERRIARESFGGNKTSWFDEIKHRVTDTIEKVQAFVEGKRAVLKSQKSAFMDQHADLIAKGKTKQADFRHKVSTLLHAAADKVDAVVEAKA